MRVTPSYCENESKAERAIYDQLRYAFDRAQDLSWFALHSLNLHTHKKKRECEADFVVCGPEGVFILEVKGGGVGCDENGNWSTTNNYGTQPLRESPFKQASGAMYAVKDYLETKLPGTQFVYGYAVVLPDTNELPSSAEWPQQIVATSREVKNFENWLRGVVKYWRERDPRSSPPILDATELKRINQALRPSFDPLLSLGSHAISVEKQIEVATEHQFIFLDVMEVQKRVLCNGSAGTGKTLMALNLAKRWSKQGKNVAVVCYSQWLKSYLATNKLPGVIFSTADGLKVQLRRAGWSKLDALIVDEGQDLINFSNLEIFDECLDGGLENGGWCFFYDHNNQSGLIGSFEEDALSYLTRMESVSPFPLTRNCRNTVKIHDYVKDLLNADIGVPAISIGPDVRLFERAGEDAVSLLEDELYELTRNQGFSYGDIVILSPLSYEKSVVSKLSSKALNMISIMDEGSPLISERNFIGFAEIKDYKGLESTVVIMVDFTKESIVTNYNSSYVGMTRAKTLLSIIYS